MKDYLGVFYKHRVAFKETKVKVKVKQSLFRPVQAMRVKNMLREASDQEK